jgi:tight adherence protein B
MLSEIPALDSILRRSGRVSQLQKLLSQGDIDVRAGNFLLFCGATGVVLGLLFLIFNRDSNLGPILGWVGMLFGFFLPYAYASYRRTKRFEKFEELFPEAIDTLARAVRAGHAFTTALQMIADEVSEPVAGEFRKLFEEQKFGLPVRDALLNLVDRMPLVDVKFFVTAAMLQRETGGNLAEILMGLSPLSVATMLVLNPGFIRPLFVDPFGHILLVLGITLQTIGYFVIRRIVRIQV